MLEDRDRSDHRQNILEIGLIVEAKGWSLVLQYLKAVEHMSFCDPELRTAFEKLDEVVQRVDRRLMAPQEEPPTNRRLAIVRRRATRRNPNG